MSDILGRALIANLSSAHLLKDEFKKKVAFAGFGVFYNTKNGGSSGIFNLTSGNCQVNFISNSYLIPLIFNEKDWIISHSSLSCGFVLQEYYKKDPLSTFEEPVTLHDIPLILKLRSNRDVVSPYNSVSYNQYHYRPNIEPSKLTTKTTLNQFQIKDIKIFTRTKKYGGYLAQFSRDFKLNEHYRKDCDLEYTTYENGLKVNGGSRSIVYSADFFPGVALIQYAANAYNIFKRTPKINEQENNRLKLFLLFMKNSLNERYLFLDIKTCSELYADLREIDYSSVVLKKNYTSSNGNNLCMFIIDLSKIDENVS